jgi:hypothetical protein
MDLLPLWIAQAEAGGSAAGVAVTQSGIGIGAALAIVCSWQRNRSLLWAILAGILSWIYVIYFALTRRSDEVR